jgi:ADP-heptose:LPS heptosyltransferase
LENHIDRILVVRTDRIGDVILTLPMAHVLKRQFPASRVAMLIREYTAELVALHASVDDVLFDDEGGHPLALRKLVAQLRAGNFDVVFHTHPRFRLAIATFMAGIPVRVGTGYRWYSFLFNRKVYEHRKDAHRHELEYNLNLLSEIGCTFAYAAEAPTFSVPEESAQRIENLLHRRGITPQNRLILLHPGSGGSARDWSPENFGLLGKRLTAMDGVAVMFTGGAGEEDILHRARSLSGPGTSILDETVSLTEFAALAHRASLFVANSTGMLHLAAAVGTPVVGLYSQLTPLSAARWGPYTERKAILTPKGKPADCRECGGTAGASCPCMDSITVDEVFDVAAGMLAAPVREISEGVNQRA